MQENAGKSWARERNGFPMFYITRSRLLPSPTVTSVSELFGDTLLIDITMEGDSHASFINLRPRGRRRSAC